MFMQNFSSLASTQTVLDTFLTIFEENFRNFQENSLANSLPHTHSQNLSFIALNTAEQAAPQILSKNRRQRRVTGGKKNSF
jgi:hypothetical protein